jgi:DNA modification methylase
MKPNARSAKHRPAQKTPASGTASMMSNNMLIEMWPIDRPKDYPKNARKWSGQAIEKVASSIDEYGWRQPVVVDVNEVIVIGHLRRAAGRFLGLTEVPVHVARDLTPAQIRGLRLADNRTNQEASWDEELLAVELAELNELDFDLGLTGFDVHELDSLLRDPIDDEKANQAPPLPDVAATQPGDLWLCGEHRVLCGDARAPEVVFRSCAGKRPFLMATDAPYGVNYDPMWREEAGLGKQRQTGRVANDDQVDWTEAYRLFPGDVAYVWHAGVHAAEVAAGLASVGFEIRAQIIWSKQHFAMSRGHYHWGHEPCWYAVRKGGKANWCGDRTQSTIWEVQNLNPMGGDRNEKATGHGTQKPVELWRRPIANHTRPGDLVFDPFLGSGTSMMAAELTGRVCYGIDIDPRYVDVAVIRWQEFTGQEATLEADGRTFAQIKAERLGIAA